MVTNQTAVLQKTSFFLINTSDTAARRGNLSTASALPLLWEGSYTSLQVKKKSYICEHCYWECFQYHFESEKENEQERLIKNQQVFISIT